MIVLVFECMLSDLSEVIRKSEHPLAEAQVKLYMLMLAFVHERVSAIHCFCACDVESVCGIVIFYLMGRQVV